MKLIIASALLAVGLVHGTYAAPAPDPGKPIPAQTVKPRATAVAPVAPAGTVKSQGKPTVPTKPQADTHYCCGPFPVGPTGTAKPAFVAALPSPSLPLSPTWRIRGGERA